MNSVGTALSGKISVVTGAGRGIGRAYALALAAEGAKVVVNDLPGRHAPPADQVVDEIRALGGEAVASYASVADFDQAGEIMATAQKAFGGLDILICNAGIIRPTHIVDADPSDWSDVLAVHATGTFNCMRHAIPVLLARGGGTIITTGDISTEVRFPRLSSYRASKAAVLVLTQHAANELYGSNINVNSVMPSATDTPMLQQFFASLGAEAASHAAATRGHYDNDAAVSGSLAPPETQPPVGVFLCTDAGRKYTGYSFQMSGSRIGVVTPHTDVEYVEPAGAEWTLHELNNQIPALLAGKPSLLRGEGRQ